MKKEKNVVSIDLLYFVLISILLWNYLGGKNILDILFIFVVSIYYFRVKMFRFRKYH